MLTIAIFVGFQLLATAYVCWRGGAPERWVAGLFVAASIATALAPLQATYTYLGLNVPVLRVDLLLLGALIAVALTADRFWPMWLAAFQLVAIGTHGVRVYDPDIVPGAYWWLTNKIGYPMVLVLAIGAWRHWQRRAAGMPEWAWTWQRLRHGHDAARASGASEPDAT